MLTMVEYVHQRIKSYPSGLIGVDLTMGNGYDTLVLAKHCRKVYAFDIQQQAIQETQKKTQSYTHITYILDSHENIDIYVHDFDIAVMNLGYLPKGNHQITTLLSSTSTTIQKVIHMMNKVLFLVVYPGHDEGYKESQWIDDYVKKLDRYHYNVSTYRMVNKNNAPYVIEIEKK